MSGVDDLRREWPLIVVGGGPAPGTNAVIAAIIERI